MARVIQEHIKTPLPTRCCRQAEGGARRHVASRAGQGRAAAEAETETIGFEFVEGPVTRSREKLPGQRQGAPRRAQPKSGRSRRRLEGARPREEPLVKV